MTILAAKYGKKYGRKSTIYDRGFRKPRSLAIGHFKIIVYSNRGDEDGHFGPGIKV